LPSSSACIFIYLYFMYNLPLKNYYYHCVLFCRKFDLTDVEITWEEETFSDVNKMLLQTNKLKDNITDIMLCAAMSKVTSLIGLPVLVFIVL